MTRKFEDYIAKRSAVPIWLAIVGPSGSGKTFSALRVATGVASVVGGEVWCVDTEGGRALAYASDFHFRHVPFAEPFGSLDYFAAVQHCAKQGAKVVIIDSGSHEHEGEGGYLRTQEDELQRRAGEDEGKRERARMASWILPASLRRRMLGGLLQLNVHLIWCFRAKEKVDPRRVDGKLAIVNLGWMPIAGEALVYEMTARCLLLPRSNGVPTWHSPNPGELETMKLPNHWAKILDNGQELSEWHGQQLAYWAMGEPEGPAPATVITLRDAAMQGMGALEKAFRALPKDEQRLSKQALDAEFKPMAQRVGA